MRMCGRCARGLVIKSYDIIYMIDVRWCDLESVLCAYHGALDQCSANGISTSCIRCMGFNWDSIKIFGTKHLSNIVFPMFTCNQRGKRNTRLFD